METGYWQPNWLGSIRVRIVAVIVFLLLLASIGSVLLMRAALLNQLDEEVRVDLEQEAEEFLLLSRGTNPQTGDPFDGDVEAIFDVYFSREVPDEGESLLAFAGGALYESRRAQGAAEPGELSAAIDYWLALDEPRRGSIDTPAGRARYIALPLSGPGDEDGLFVVANFPAFEQGEIDDAVRTELAVEAITLVFVSLLGLALAGRVLRPLRRLAATAKGISDTDLTQRIPVSGRDEASQIAGAFNDMLARLERTFETQRRFLDDTSHELRSPLTVIRGHVELLELSADPVERRETIELVTDEIDRISNLVDDLSLLARAEQPGFLDVQPVDLRDLVLAVHRKATALGDRDWLAEPPRSAVIAADRHRLTQALLQLAENAVKYTGTGMVIRIGADVVGDEARFWVDDSCRRACQM